MDRRETMPMLGSAPLYMQRGLSELHGSQGGGGGGGSSMPNSVMSFQSNVVGSSAGGGLVGLEQTPPADGLGVRAASLQPSAMPVRRKRGRPRKYGPDGRVSLALSSILATPRGMNFSSEKRGRGRPPGSGRKQPPVPPFGRLVSSSAGVGFTPHVITASTGEDISAKIVAFAQQGPRAVCILSANGTVSTAILRQPSTSGGTVTYEGHFDILSMSGSFLLVGNDSSFERSGGLSISLASPDGRVVGGGIGGMLIAASPVQVVVGSFIWTSQNTNQKMQKVREGGGESQHYTVETQPSQNLMTNSSSMATWQTLDMRNSHVDIDLMRG
ncbi:hypothetical protein RND81_01G196600 [Saponaria officinalis]|uniref:AT-hook motif nuclear-localized protein n=1 Tax=Saponaria officinalis TaxID=3572 RepID=A0AAW1N8S2_SAPOF